MKRMNKKLAIVVAIMILTLSIASTGFAAEAFINLKAYYKDIKIFKNGQQVQLDVKPFIVDGTTYVPVRAISNIVNKDVTWDQATYSIGINDKADATSAALTTKMIQQEIKIVDLEAKVKDLEAKLAVKEKETTVSSISDMEKALNKDYGTYSKVDFDIDLTESKTKKTIDVEVYVDLDEDSAAWKKLGKDGVTEYLQNIADDIRAAFKDHTITGYVYDEDAGVKVYTFTLNKRNQVILSTKTSGSGSSTTLSDLEDDLYYKFEGYYGITDIEVSGTTSRILVEVYVDYDDWEDLKSSERTAAGNKIIDFVEYDFPNATIDVDIINDSNGKVLREF